MSYRFLPWVRQGLAARITDPDGLGATIPARARFPVRVSLSTGDTASVDLRLYGPGDVIGVDPRCMVRTEPPRFTRNAAPDQFVAIEFDPPDFPWLFSPARAGTQDRLRPWCVLVVVEVQEGVAINVLRDRPLPQLVIEPPAVPTVELPDLTESWAWAHTHVVESQAPASVPNHLRDHPDQNIARILCPRRLEPNRDYLACLVPAFEAGRLAGLGQTVPETPTTQAAWGTSGSVGASITLPVYFHWEFRTGLAGDFESLARRLTPRPLPATVGFRRMYIGNAHAALPALPAAGSGMLLLEGALRAPDAGSGDPLGPEHDEYVDGLVDILNAPADHPLDGASANAESVAPPVYGGAHVKVERLDGSEHRWLGELNRDPRHRAAAGLGTEIVRQNQERYMNAAWAQVGDVLKANARLDLARFVKEAMTRIHRRHIAPLPADTLLGLTAPVHDRISSEVRSVANLVGQSTLPPGTLDASFRRMASPRSPLLRRAERLAGAAAGVATPIDVVSELANGQRQLDLLATVPDGLVSSRLLDQFGAEPGEAVGSEIGAPSTVAGSQIVAARSTAEKLSAKPMPTTVTIRPDLAITGVVLRSPVRGVNVIGARPGLAGAIKAVLSAVRETPGGVGLRASFDELGHMDVEVIDDDRGPIRRAPVRPSRPGQPSIPSGPTVRVGPPLPAGPTRPTGPTLPSGPIQPGGPTFPTGPILPGRPTGPGDPTIPIDPAGPPVLRPPVKDPAVVKRFDTAFGAHRAALEHEVQSIIPPPKPLNLAAARATLVAAVDPRPVIDARARLAIKVGGRILADGLSGPLVRQEEPLDPIMVGPLLPEALYKALAEYDPDRFLPGIGDIPDDTVTMLETNPRFVEAFMIGANHEMNRELLWRRYPTDRRGTPFRKFWERVDGSDDIAAIHSLRRNVTLGTSTGADLRGSLTLLVRGQLLRRFPNAVVYATPALPDGTLDLTPAAARNPVFWGRLAPDVTFVGFDLTREDVEPAPGWFFVIAEQPAEPRFGLDVPPGGAPGPLASWSDLNWAHVGVQPGGHLRLVTSGLMGQQRDVVSGGPRATFGRNSAHLAAITFQRPFRAAIHSSEMIAGAEGPSVSTVPAVLTHSVLLKPLLQDGRG